MAQIDPADERDVAIRIVPMDRHDELLMVRAGAPHALVEQHRSTGRRDDPRELGLLLLVEAQRRGMGAPEQPADVDAPAGELGEDRRERRTVVGQLLVVVTAPVCEAHEIARTERLELRSEPREVRGAVNQRLHVVAVGPVLVADERAPGMRPLARVQEPRVDLHPSTLCVPRVERPTRRSAVHDDARDVREIDQVQRPAHGRGGVGDDELAAV